MKIKKTGTRPNLLIVTAHPDDVENGMGGTAYLLKDAYHIHIAIASKGERGLSKAPRRKTAEIRMKEVKKAASILNATVHYLGKIDGEIYADKDGVDSVVTLLDKLAPRIIFLIWPIDKPDHAAASNMALIALAKTGMIHDHEVYFFRAGREATKFDPDIYVDISLVWKKKVEMIRCHECQNTEDRLVKAIEASDKASGCLNRCDYAETFKTVYPLTSSRWNKKITHSLLDIVHG